MQNTRLRKYNVDFININEEENKRSLKILEEELPKSGLIINGGKTEFIDITTKSRPDIRKLGSRIDSDNDIRSRISAGNIAFKRLRELWKRKKHITAETKLALYQTTIISVLTYNLGSNAAHENHRRKLDCIHRKHLRQILNIYYPNKISNQELYARCKTTSISQQIREMRWNLFGHLLRLEVDTPPQKLMEQYLTMSATKKCIRGGQYWTLPRLLDMELGTVGKQLKKVEDLKELRSIARFSEKWRKLRNEIVQKWVRIEKIKRAIKKKVILLTPARAQEEKEEDRVNLQNSTEDEEEKNQAPKKRRRIVINEEKIVLRLSKRSISALICTTSMEDGNTITEKLWKRRRRPEEAKIESE